MGNRKSKTEGAEGEPEGAEVKQTRGCCECYEKVFYNRWFRLVVFSLATLLTSCIYFGWQHYSRMLFADGAFDWECEDLSTTPYPTSTTPPPDEEDDPWWWPCDEQNEKVQAFYSIAAGFEFIMCVVAGLLLDNVGPLICGMIGEVVWALGMITQAYANSNFAYYFAAFLIGSAVNLIAFPTLILEDIFPSHSGLVLSLIISCQTASTIVAPILWAVMESSEEYDDVTGETTLGITLQDITWGYLLCVWLPITILLGLSLPMKRPKLVESQAKEAAEKEKRKHQEEERMAAKMAAGDGEAGEETGASGGEEEEAGGDKAVASGGEEEDGAAGDVEGGTAPKGRDSCLGHAHVLDPEDHREFMRSMLPPKEEKKEWEEYTPKPSWKSFGIEMCTIEFQLLTTYYVLNLMQFNYWPTVTLDIYGTAISDYMGYLLPTQAIWGLIFGALCDLSCWSTVRNAYYLAFATLFTYGFAWADQDSDVWWIQYISITLFVIAQSWIYTTKFTYVSEIFPATNFGKLVGYVGLIAGLCTFLNIPIRNWGNHAATSIIYFCVSLVLFAILIYLDIRQSRWKRTHKIFVKKEVEVELEAKLIEDEDDEDDSPIGKEPAEGDRDDGNGSTGGESGGDEPPTADPPTVEAEA